VTTSYTLHHGDCLDVLRTLPDASVDAVITDPLAFAREDPDMFDVIYNAVRKPV